MHRRDAAAAVSLYAAENVSRGDGADRAGLFPGGSSGPREEMTRALFLGWPVNRFHRYEVLHYNSTHVHALPRLCDFPYSSQRLLLRAGSYCSTAGASCFRGADTAVAAANRFGRARHACRAGREWEADSGCYGEFFERRPADNRCDGQGPFPPAAEFRGEFWFD